jgi:hypothetical protein
MYIPKSKLNPHFHTYPRAFLGRKCSLRISLPLAVPQTVYTYMVQRMQFLVELWGILEICIVSFVKSVSHCRTGFDAFGLVCTCQSRLLPENMRFLRPRINVPLPRASCPTFQSGLSFLHIE